MTNEQKLKEFENLLNHLEILAEELQRIEHDLSTNYYVENIIFMG